MTCLYARTFAALPREQAGVSPCCAQAAQAAEHDEWGQPHEKMIAGPNVGDRVERQNPAYERLRPRPLR
jgi:hypothetical protein